MTDKQLNEAIRIIEALQSTLEEIAVNKADKETFDFWMTKLTKLNKQIKENK